MLTVQSPLAALHDSAATGYRPSWVSFGDRVQTAKCLTLNEAIAPTPSVCNPARFRYVNYINDRLVRDSSAVEMLDLCEYRSTETPTSRCPAVSLSASVHDRQH
jgi:hypothetical protein